MKNYQFITLIVLILLWIGSTHYILSKLPEKITANMLAIEYDKVWWMENYVKLNKIQRDQAILFLKQYEAQNWQIQNQQLNQQEQNNNENKISLEQVKKITWENVYILWNPDAEISWVEYSDLECPYCKKLHESWTIEKILKEYNWKVNFIFKQFPLTRIHPQAPMEAESALCVWELWWSQKYHDFIMKVYNGSQTNWKSYNLDTITKLAWEIWIDTKKFNECVKSWKYAQLAWEQLNEWNKIFWITWTPGNVLINNKTWKWDKLPWAYPYEAFKQKIDSLMK
jgi:protein-disulfide isomerase